MQLGKLNTIKSSKDGLAEQAEIRKLINMTGGARVNEENKGLSNPQIVTPRSDK
jgi:hypothetical protein